MNKEYLEYLKKHDPMHYCEMMGDPVTGLNHDSGDGYLIFPIVIVLVVGMFIGSLIF